MSAYGSARWPWPARSETRGAVAGRDAAPAGAQVVIHGRVFTIAGADHLKVDGSLVEIQRSAGSGYETLAVAGDDLLVTIGPARPAGVQLAGDQEPSDDPPRAWMRPA